MLSYNVLLLGPGLFISLHFIPGLAVGANRFRTIWLCFFSFIIRFKSFANLNLSGLKKDNGQTERRSVQEIILILKYILKYDFWVTFLTQN